MLVDSCPWLFFAHLYIHNIHTTQDIKSLHTPTTGPPISTAYPREALMCLCACVYIHILCVYIYIYCVYICYTNMIQIIHAHNRQTQL